MARRRMRSSTVVRSPLARAPKRRMRSSNGITRSLHTMVDTAMASTITMPVAAERPPTNANKANAPCPCDSGNDSTKVSGSMRPGPKCSRPPSAMGNTNRLISNRYSGNAQTARLRCFSSTFSTTITWNWRGRKITDSMASKVRPSHCA